MNIDLTGKIAIVCGSTKGIGKAIAVELASLGCNVTLFARDKEAMHKTLNDLDSQSGGRFMVSLQLISTISGR